MIFRFVVRRLKWLRAVPLLPLWFDAALLTITAAFDPAKLRAIEALQVELIQTSSMKLRLHRYGGVGFYARNTELGHVHGNGLVDVLVGRTERERLVRSGKADPHHVFPNSGWISFWLRDETDVPCVLELFQRASLRTSAFE